MNAQSTKQAGEPAGAETAAEAASRIGLELAGDLFDTQALLEALEARLHHMSDGDAIEGHAGDMLARVVRVAAARVGAAAEVGMNLRHALDAGRRADAPGVPT